MIDVLLSTFLVLSIFICVFIYFDYISYKIELENMDPETTAKYLKRFVRSVCF